MVESQDESSSAIARPTPGQRLTLAGIFALSAAAGLWRLGTVGLNGFGNFYYAAAVQSMLRSWHNLFFLSFDPSGFLALDKPPLAHWMQALSAQVFGFKGRALLLPQVVAGSLSVLLLWHLVRRAFGNWVGIAAALLLALSPVSVLAARNNTAEAHVVLVMLLAAWCVTLAAERDSLPPLLLGGALVGVGFNIKMLQLGLAAPGLVLLYLAGSRLPWRRRLLHGASALLVALLVASPWMVAVELTPSGQRPYIDGSASNSVLDLVVGYNGVARLWGEDWSAVLGDPGPLRLLNSFLGGQTSWFLPLALFGLGLAIAMWARGGLATRERHAALLWTGWVVLQLVYFSSSSFFHRYYLAVLAPGLAASAAMACAMLRRAARGRGGQWAIGLVYALTLLGQVAIVWPHAGEVTFVIPAMAVLAVGGAVSLLAGRPSAKLGSIGVSLLALSLLVGPAVWIAISLTACPYSAAAATMPAAGPRTDCQPRQARPWLEPTLLEYLLDNRQGATYLGATYDLGISGLAIMATGEPFLTLGGYRGNMPILTLGEFAALVESGEVRFFLSLSPDSEHEIQRPIREWVADHCPPLPELPEGVLVYGPCAVRK